MRLKSNIISVVYADRNLLDVGGFLAAEGYGWSESYTTSAEDLLASEAPELVSHQNARGEMQLPVCIDFESEIAAFTYSMEARAHARANQTGKLTIAVGSSLNEWQAGLNGLNAEFRYVGSEGGSRVRLTLTYSFVLGGAV